MDQKQGIEREGAQVRWNLFALMLDVSFFSIGMAFTDGNAVLPLLLKRLGGSTLLIGIFGTLQYLAFNGFQIVVAWASPGSPVKSRFWRRSPPSPVCRCWRSPTSSSMPPILPPRSATPSSPS